MPAMVSSDPLSAAAATRKAPDEGSPGTVGAEPFVLVALEGHGSVGDRNGRPERGEGPLRVIAGADRFPHLGRTIRIEAREQHRALHLGARGSRLEDRPGQRSAGDLDRSDARPSSPRRPPSTAAGLRRVPSGAWRGSGRPRARPRTAPRRARHTAGASSCPSCRSRAAGAAPRGLGGPHPRPQVAGCSTGRRNPPPRGSTWNRDPPRADHRSKTTHRVQVEPCRVTPARHDAVDRTSREDGTSTRALLPSAVAARMIHRWATDLSPGTCAVPASRPPGMTRIRIVLALTPA